MSEIGGIMKHLDLNNIKTPKKSGFIQKKIKQNQLKKAGIIEKQKKNNKKREEGYER